MKRLIYTALAVCSGALLFTSCFKDQEDLFDNLPTKRLDDRVTEIAANLTSAETWVMPYFTTNTGMLGGFNLAFTFKTDPQAVDITLEPCVITDYTLYNPISSFYVVKPGQGPELSFDTYNQFLHLFAQASSSNPKGLEGDYEFMVTDMTADKIHLKGIKHGYTQIMMKLPEGMTATDYFDQVTETSEYLTDMNNPALEINGVAMPWTNTMDSYGDTDLDYRLMIVKDPATGITYEESYAVLPNALLFYEPVTIGGVTFRNFAYDETTGDFVCSDEGVTGVRIRPYTEHVAAVLLNSTWWFKSGSGTNMSASFATAWTTAFSQLTTAYGMTATMRNAYLGTDVNLGPVFYFTLGLNAGSYAGAWVSQFLLSEENKVVLNFTGSYYGGNNTINFYNAGMYNIMDAMATDIGPGFSRTYTVTMAEDGNTMRLTDVAASTRWFVLYKNQQAY